MRIGSFPSRIAKFRVARMTNGNYRRRSTTASVNVSTQRAATGHHAMKAIAGGATDDILATVGSHSPRLADNLVHHAFGSVITPLTDSRQGPDGFSAPKRSRHSPKDPCSRKSRI